MTPFDPAALLVMLLAFYPIVSVGELARARRDRPEYFAGGTLTGSKGDKLALPDGRVFDLIYAAGGPPGAQRWQVIEDTGGGGAGGDGLELTPGALAPLGDLSFGFDPNANEFEALIGSALADLGDADGALVGVGGAVADVTTGADLGASFDHTVAPAAEAHAELRAALDGDDPAELIGATNAQDGTINMQSGDYDEPPPDDLAVNDPGDPPHDDTTPPPDVPPQV